MRRGIRAWNNYVAQQHGERLVPDKLLCHQHGVAEAQRFLLPRVAEVHHAADFAHQFRQIGFAFPFQETFQFRRRIEVVFDGVLSPAGHDNDVVNAGGDAFLDDVLDQRLVDHRQHFFWLRFGGR